ncbi:hypothetical protein M8C21_016404, partial [Ambrosia artemisiifolia]
SQHNNDIIKKLPLCTLRINSPQLSKLIRSHSLLSFNNLPKTTRPINRITMPMPRFHTTLLSINATTIIVSCSIVIDNRSNVVNVDVSGKQIFFRWVILKASRRRRRDDDEEEEEGG